jgi:hypothetical protein
VTFDLRSDDHKFYLHVITIKIFTLDILPLIYGYMEWQVHGLVYTSDTATVMWAKSL